MSESMFASSRTFRVWLYSVSHSILLLRSVKENSVSTRIDLIFKPVRYMCLPAMLNGIDVRLVTAVDLKDELADVIGAYESKDKIFALSGEKGGAWVVSGAMAWHEDAGEDSDPSYFNVPRMVW